MGKTPDSRKQRPTAQKTHVNPNAAFPFQDDFSIGMIHGAKAKTPTQDTAAAIAAAEIVEIKDDDNNVSVLTSKTTSKVQTNIAVGYWVATGSNPVSSPTADFTQSETASGGSKDLTIAGPASGASGGPDGK